MQHTTLITFLIALSATFGFLFTLGILNLLVGSLFSYFRQESFTFLKSSLGRRGFAFVMDVGANDEPTNYDTVSLKLFNASGTPTRVDVIKSFPVQSQSFALDLDMGPLMETLCTAQGMEKGKVVLEVSSGRTGNTYAQTFKGSAFKKKINTAQLTLAEFNKTQEEVAVETVEKQDQPEVEKISYGIQNRNFVADTVPGKGAHLKIVTNPIFSSQLKISTAAPAGEVGGQAAAPGAASGSENFSLKKVWIIEGCIVCNACEDIYPEVFEVKADTCVVRPNPPLNDGLKVKDAAEACPVEVIKYERA